MSASAPPPRKTPTKGRAGRARRHSRGATQQPTKAELQAIEARRRATILVADDTVVAVEEPPVRRSRPATTRRSDQQRQPAPRPALSREQEYSYIRSDLRRLIVTAGPLLLLMLALLFVLDR